ncbi:unnamed protein product [Paramecium pentaurelia]|uniref:Uncharacterized protein n=1 Tax=Paramecium pentaurelia TaxID=43138 RepID=A0A8S1TRU3_9CILI|nr:unnamed protein product [Paramecium pentaurelia]
MHKFLFGNRRKNISSYNPFGSQKNMKPGIITKIKNKIQGLFQPTINSQSLIQRIQSFDDKNLEQELSNQFKNNLVLIDRIIPNKDDIIILKRKSICPFEQYLKEEMDSDKKISKETQTDMSSKPSDSQIKTSNVKKKKKFKKEHSKINKSRKMEENPKQLEFNLNKQNFKQNLNQKYENQSEYQFNYSNKRLKQFDSFTESSIPIKQKGETSDYLSPVKILENQSIIQNDDNNNLKCDSFLKELKVSSSSAQSPSNNNHFKDELNKNNKFSSSTGTNSKGEGNETILSFKNVYFQQEPQENIKDIDQNKKPSIIQQNQEQEFENNQKSNESCIQILNQNNLIIKNENNNNLNDKDNNKQEHLQIQTIDVIQKQIKGNKQQEAENKEQNNIQNSSLLDSNSNDKQFHTIKQCHIETNTTKQLSNQISQQQDIKNEQQLENQQDKIGQEVFQQQNQFLNQNLLSQNEQQDYLSEKTSKFQNSLPQQSKDIQKNILQTSFLNNQNKQTVDKSIKEQNPFLTQSSNISSDQISLYFQAFSTSNQNKQCQPQNQNQPIIDLFKISTQQPQQIIPNKPQDKQNTQNLLQNSNNFGNAKILQYSTNKQMEIIEQAPTQINQIIQGKQQDFEIAQLNYQQQPNQQNNLFQQQQQQNYPQQLMQQQNFQFQNLFSQQQQTSNQISSLNLFQTSTYQQQQNDINNKPLFLKNDVLSLFQDTKKSDRDIFQTPQYQQTSQSLNNSFNKVKKKQRINNF